MEELTPDERARRRLTAQVMQLAEELRAIDRRRIETTSTEESADDPSEERFAEPPTEPTAEEKSAAVAEILYVLGGGRL